MTSVVRASIVIRHVLDGGLISPSCCCGVTISDARDLRRAGNAVQVNRIIAALFYS